MNSGLIHDHELQMFADRYCLADETGTVTGEVRAVADTSFDFTNIRPIGLHISEVGKGYDHCYLVNGEVGVLRPVARVRDPKSGRIMEVETTEPGVQFYTANNLKPKPRRSSSRRLHSAWNASTVPTVRTSRNFPRPSCGRERLTARRPCTGSALPE